MAKTTKNIQYYEAVGRRKRSVARVRLYITSKDKTAAVADKKMKAGEIYVNNQHIGQIFPSSFEKEYYSLPLKLTNNIDRFAISILVNGGGKKGQLEAITHGISRALRIVDKDAYSTLLKTEKLLTRDPRKKQRRRVGTGGKARRAKQSPKR